jgi:hypothetical protein
MADMVPGLAHGKTRRGRITLNYPNASKQYVVLCLLTEPALPAALEYRPRDAEGVFGEAPCDDFIGFVYRICAMEEV